MENREQGPPFLISPYEPRNKDHPTQAANKRPIKGKDTFQKSPNFVFRDRTPSDTRNRPNRAAKLSWRAYEVGVGKVNVSSVALLFWSPPQSHNGIDAVHPRLPFACLSLSRILCKMRNTSCTYDYAVQRCPPFSIHTACVVVGGTAGGQPSSAPPSRGRSGSIVPTGSYPCPYPYAVFRSGRPLMYS